MQTFNTSLPYFLRKVTDKHNRTIWYLSQYLKKRGITLEPGYWEKEQYMRRTHINLKIMHDNDYIEVGPSIADPEGVMFNVFTIEKTSVKFPAKLYTETIKILQNLSDKLLEGCDDIPKRLHPIRFDFFSWTRDLESSGLDDKNLELRIVFKVYHKG